MNLNLLGRIGARRNTLALATEPEEDEEAAARAAEDDDTRDEDAKAAEPDEGDEEKAKESTRRRARSDEDDEDLKAATAGQIARLCAEAGCPAMAEGLADRGVSVRQLREEIGTVARIRAMVSTARRIDKAAISTSLADRFIAAGHSPAEAGEALLEMLAGAQSPEIRNSHGASARPGGRVDHGWDRIVAGVNARIP